MSNSNYFELPNPDELVCYRAQYSIQTWSLVISIQDPSMLDRRFKLFFSHATFVQCPTSWTGAAFRLGTAEELRTTVNERLPHKLSEAELLDQARLYTAIVRTGSPRSHTILILSRSRNSSKVTEIRQRFE